MINAKFNSRPTDLQEMNVVLKTFNQMNEVQKDIVENAVLEIYSMFGMEPSEYEFDFRFHRR